MKSTGIALLVVFTLGSIAAAQVPAAAVKGLEWRSIGPATTGGRIADVTATTPAGGPQIMYVGTASGGVFKSSNAGVSWTPVFDQAGEQAGAMMSIGAVAVAPSNPDVVWVGTGEVDNRQSSSWGNGIYKSVDGGATWHAMGLAETRHIGKIVIDPGNPNIVYVAATGHLWGPNPERGVYKTTDGGASWKKVLYTDDNTGAIDLAMSPSDPNLIFAAMYQHQRRGWGYNGGGPSSGIYRSSDGGATWTELSRGLPRSDKGRIGLAINPRDSRIVYAIVEADPQPAGGGRGGAAGLPGFGNTRPAPALRGGVFRSDDQGETWEQLSTLNPRPSYYSRIYLDPRDPNRVYIMGSERGFYISDDGGRNFRDVFSEVHGEDHAMWVDPANPEHLLIGGDGGVSISYDRGESWIFRDNLPIGQFYDISTNQATPYLICGGLQDNGNWCTPSASHLSYGLSNRDAFNVGGGDGMQATFDGDNNTVLVSSQNGNTGRVSLDTMQRQSIAPVLPETEPAGGGRGGDNPDAYRWYWTAPLIVSPKDPNVIYTGANVLFRSADRGLSWKAISPDLTAHIDRSKLEMMGGLIPANALSKNDGQDNFSALTVIAASPLDTQLLYTGADDGTLERTRDGGAHWTNLTANVAGLPAMTNVSGIVASQYAAGRVYATFDGHFNDDYHPYVYVSEDYGQTWTPIVAGLPEASVHRIRENPSNPDFLVAGLEEGVYASWDRGGHWTSLNTNFPPVPVYDLVYQTTTHDLVLGTHGRGIWVLDDSRPLAALGAAAAGGGAHLFSIAAAHPETIYSPQAWFGAGEFFAPNPPSGAVIHYYLPPAEAGAGAETANEAVGAGGRGRGRGGRGGRGGAVNLATVTIADAAGATVRSFSAPAQAGMNEAVWDLRLQAPLPPTAEGGRGGGGGGFGRGGSQGPLAAPGSYSVSVRLPRGGADAAPLTGTVTVTSDPRATATAAQMRQRDTAVMAAYHLQQRLAPARAAVNALAQQLGAMRAYAAAMQTADADRAEPSAAMDAVEKAAAQLAPLDAELNRGLSQAATAQRGMDGYDGPPTADQLRQLAWAQKDASEAVDGINVFLKQTMPSVYRAVGGGRWTPVPPVPTPGD